MKRLMPILLACLLVLPIAQAENLKQSRLASHVQSLNELTERRRISTFYTNEQTLKYGLSVGHVNAGLANLTFIRRDLVATTHLPVIVARVYDSSLPVSPDFGQGWRLTLAETITEQQDGTLLYVDDSASPWKIVPTQSGYSLAQGEVSDITKIDVLPGQSLQIGYQSSWRKTFTLLGDRYRLTRIFDAFDNGILLTYDEQHSLSKIDGQNGRYVNISRDEHGRIIGITDDLNRQVTYQFDKKGRLASVNDLGVHQWRYAYNGKGLLTKVTDPEGQNAATFNYGADNKTIDSNVRGIKHRYHYRNNQTTVTDQNKNTTILVQEKNGITTQVTNAEGRLSTIELDANNQITKLSHDGLLSAQLSYNQDGRVNQLKRRKSDGTFELLSYNFDYKGRLTGVSKGQALVRQTTFNPQGQPLRITINGTEKLYTYGKNGEVLSHSEGSIHRTFGYNAMGLLTSMAENGAKAAFDFNNAGKLTKITFPDGSNHQYQYNARGLRTETRRSDGSIVYYSYDKAGNLTELRKITANGDGQQRDIMLDANLTQQFIVGSEQALDITYSDNGNPTAIVYSGKTVNYQYDEVNRLVSIDEGQGEPINYQYKDGEDDIRIQLDDRSRKIATPAKLASRSFIGLNSLYTRSNGSAWRHVGWNETLGRIQLVSDEGYIAPDANFKSSSQRRRLYNAIATGKKNQRAFDKPSSSVFVPVEYSAVNCEPQYCGMDAVILHGPSEVMFNEIADFSAQALIFELKDCEPSFSFYVDGSFAHTNSSGDLSINFATPGSHSVDISAVCAYCPWVGVLYAARHLNVKCPEDGCLQVTTRTIKSSTLPNSRNILGVGEVIELTANFLGKWEIVQGGGLLERAQGDETRYIAPDVATTVKIKITAGSESKIVELIVITPSDLIMKRQPNTNLRHVFGQAGVGFKAQMFLYPDIVNFNRVEVYEPFDSSVKLVTTDYFDYEAGKLHFPGPQLGPEFGLDGDIHEVGETVTPFYGTLVEGIDKIVGVGTQTPYDDGTAYWDIPWNYKVVPYLNSHYLLNLKQQKEINGWGDMSVSKGGHTESAKFLDATTNWD